MKGRMSLLDIGAEVARLNNVLKGCKVVNVYDINAKTYMLKLQRTGFKCRLIMESGVRFHTTNYNRDKSLTPNGFTLKLRKHIRQKRLDEVRQLGVDRVVDFVFGFGDQKFHIILELYAAGNIILTDEAMSMMMVLRRHIPDQPDRQRYAVRETYDLDFVHRPQVCTQAMLKSWTQSTTKPAEESLDESQKQSSKISNGSSSKPHTSTNKKKSSVYDRLLEHSDFGKALVEHALIKSVGEEFKSLDCDTLWQPDQANIVHRLLEELHTVHGMLFSDTLKDAKGFIIMSAKDGKTDLFDEFVPEVLEQYKGREIKEFATFDDCMDEFFSTFERQRAENAQAQNKKAAESKVDRVRKENSARVEALDRAIDLANRKANLIEINLGDVDVAIQVINSMLASGMDWTALEAEVKLQRMSGNPIAEAIRKLDLPQNKMVMMLGGSEHADDETLAYVQVEVDLSETAYGNAQLHYANRKKLQAKRESTLKASEKAIKGAEKKAKHESLKKAASLPRAGALQQIRQPFWFEKFHWFVTSENYLVLSGKDANQNELLVKRYMNPNDVYIHADAYGASSTVVKNPMKGQPVPPFSLAEAGTFNIFHSSSWASKIVTSAYWVEPSQVSKTAPTGEYLKTGGFMVRGKRNHLEPQQLVAGFGILFKVHESCVEAHRGERRVRGLEASDVPQRALSSVSLASTFTASSVSTQQSIQQLPGRATSSSSALADCEGQSEALDGSSSAFDSEQHDGEESSEREQRLVRNMSSSAVTATSEGTESVLIRTHSSNSGGASDCEGILDQLSQAALEDSCAEDNDSSKSPHVSSSSTAGYSSLAGDLTAPLSAERTSYSGASPFVGGTGISVLDRFDRGVSFDAVDGSSPGLRVTTVDMDRLIESDEENEVVESLLAGSHSVGERQKHKHMSAAQRRKVRKAASKGEVCDDGGEHTAMDAIPTPQAQAEGKTTTSSAPAPVRGKKGKAKKMKDKYRDQDDEERAIRMAALGHKIVSPAEAAIEEERKRMEEASSKPKPKREVRIDDKLDPEEEARMIGFDLDSLTAQPKPDDVIIMALPVVAPYHTMKNYKFKVKLQPGTLKKGKACKAAVETFLSVSGITSQEQDAIRRMTDADMSAQMLGDVKIVSTGQQPGRGGSKGGGKKGKR